MRPLDGLKVLELSHMLSAPSAGLLLADLGADVVKLEKVDGGEDTRRLVPPTIAGESASFMILNRGKRGLALDIKSPAGKDAFMKMLGGADVLLENYRPGTMQKLGFGYEALHARYPSLIYCQISGFGATGPYADLPGLDLIAQGMSGLMSVTGEGPGRPPVKAGGPISDVSAGHLAVAGILAAYIQRLKTGRGQLVDTSLLDAAIVHTYWISAMAFATRTTPEALGSAHAMAVPYQALPTSDGHVNVGCSTQPVWLRLMKVLRDPALENDARYRDNPGRKAHAAELIAQLSAVFATRTTAQWVEALRAGGIPCGPVLSIPAMHRDPHVLAREMVIQVEHPIAGTVDAIGCPIKMSESAPPGRGAAPLLGEHSAAVLRDYGFEPAEIDALVRSGVVVD